MSMTEERLADLEHNVSEIFKKLTPMLEVLDKHQSVLKSQTDQLEEHDAWLERLDEVCQHDNDDEEYGIDIEEMKRLMS